MGRRTVEIKIIECDMCSEETSIVRWQQIYLNGQTWDLCDRCVVKFKDVSTFLSHVVGIDVNIYLHFPRWITRTASLSLPGSNDMADREVVKGEVREIVEDEN